MFSVRIVFDLKNFFFAPLRCAHFSKEKRKKTEKKRKKKANQLGWRGWAVKVFGKKILPEWVEIFLSKPVGLDLD
jgi:hypothetical protein